LVKEVSVGGSPSRPPGVLSGSTLFFIASAPETGDELWRSDGTEAGTALVKDVNLRTGDTFIFPFDNPDFTAVGATVYFAANDPVNGAALWKTDGTPGGTALVKPQTVSAFDPHLVEAGGTLFYRGQDFRLWKSDGTPDGTVPVLPEAATVNGVERLTAVGDTLFFFGFDSQGYALFATDGTAAGTRRLAGFGSSSSNAGIGALLDADGTLYFTALFPAARGLWKSNGTPEGTVLVKSLVTPNPDFVQLAYLNGNVMLGFDRQLWRSDGTEAGTVQLRTFSTSFTEPSAFTVSGGQLYFSAGSLWVSDGTAAGTRPIPAAGFNLTAYNGLLYYTAPSPAGTDGLWRTDGTDAGTVLVKSLPPWSVGTGPHSLTVYDRYLFFVATDGDQGAELWRSDGTEAGTSVYQDLRPGQFQGSFPQFLRAAAGRLYFTADDGLRGREAWVVTVPQTVLSVVVNDGSAQRSSVTSVTVTFTGVVTVGEGAFELFDAKGKPIDLIRQVLEVAGRTVVILTFASDTEQSGSLRDGRYRLLIHSDRITDALGQALDADADGEPGGVREARFFRLFGDSDGDADVDDADLAVFEGAFGTQAGDPGYLAFLDFDLDGVIGPADRAKFRQRYGTLI
jgi:ELWxxDGT repeat protein